MNDALSRGIGGGRAVLEEHLAAVEAQEGAEPLQRRAALRTVGPYRGYAELLRAIAALADGPADLLCLGRSVEGAPIFGLALGEEASPRASVVLGGLHAMEWIGVEAALALAARLLVAPPSDRRLLLVPLVNVDGLRRVEADLVAGRRRFVRVNARGVDLNRNWPSHFRPRPWLARLAPWLGSSGAAPRSEPEVDAVAAACDELARSARLDRALSLHSFGNKVLYPYGGLWRPPVAVEALRGHARALQGRLRAPYGVVQSSRWVPGFFAPGMELDHLHDAYGAASLLVECGQGGLRWNRPSSWLHPFRWFNPPEPGPVAEDVATAVEPFVRGGT